MTWTKLSDDFGDDLWTTSDAAFRLHIEGLLWSNRKLLDLRIPKDDLRLFAKHPEAISELLAGGWWKETDDHYVIVHHAMYQRTRDAIINQQKVNKANRAQRGQSTPPTRELLPRQPRPRRSNDSLHDSSNDSLHEMDRTGQDLAFNSDHLQNDDLVADQQTGEVLEAGSEPYWRVRVPGSGPNKTEASRTEPVVEAPPLPEVGDSRAEVPPAESVPTCSLPGCGSRLYSPENKAMGICRVGGDEHERARRAKHDQTEELNER